MTETETYHITYHCKNCGSNGEIDIAKKIQVSEANCPVCDCKETLILLEPKKTFTGTEPIKVEQQEKQQ